MADKVTLPEKPNVHHAKEALIRHEHLKGEVNQLQAEMRRCEREIIAYCIEERLDYLFTPNWSRIRRHFNNV